MGLIFTDVRIHAHYAQCNQTYFVGLIFVIIISQSSTKLACT